MKIYLAGGINGNLKPLWSNIVNSSKDFRELEYKYENFWQGGNQDIGYTMDWFRRQKKIYARTI